MFELTIATFGIGYLQTDDKHKTFTDCISHSQKFGQSTAWVLVMLWLPHRVLNHPAES
jgi:hypothetical protein